MKKIISLFLCISVICLVAGISPAFAVSFNNADSYSIGDTQYGIISESNSENVSEFILDSAGRISINYTAEGIESSNLKIYDESGQEIWSESPYWDSTSKQISFIQDVELTQGTYYFMVSRRYGDGTYSFEIDFANANETFEEEQGGSNNTFKVADIVEINGNYTGQIAVNDEVDNYIVELETAGKIKLSYRAENIESSTLKIYDGSGQEIWSESPYWDSTSKYISFAQDIDLTKGTYYFMVSKRYGYGTYELSLPFESADETFEEEQGGSNNTFKTADDIDMNENYIGQIALNDEVDMYKFNFDSSGTINFSYNAENIESSTIKFYNESGQEIWNESPYWDSTSKQISFNEDITLESGLYYLVISKRYGYGSYSFTLGTEGYSFSNGNADDNKNDDEYDYDEPFYDDKPFYDDDFITTDDDMTSGVINVYSNDLSIDIDGEKVYFPDAAPFIDSAGRTQVPIRFIAEELGYSVDWWDLDPTSRWATISVWLEEWVEGVCYSNIEKTIDVYIGSSELIVSNYKVNEDFSSEFQDYDTIQMDTSAIIKNDRTYIPLRFVAEALGYTVNWK